MTTRRNTGSFSIVREETAWYQMGGKALAAGLWAKNVQSGTGG
jgi:hypothetical protein